MSTRPPTAGRRFEGRAALVTGAGSGIGAATARRLAAEGAAVAVVDVEEPAAEAVADSVSESGGRAIAVAADVGSRGEVDRAVHAALDAFGRLDVLHNNAGVGSMLPLALVDDATIERLLATNVRGVVNGMAIAGPIMAEAGGGAIVNTASAAAVFGAPLQVVYSGTKGAVVSLTRAAAMELAPTVRVNAVCPGGVRTAFVDTALGMPAPPQLEEAGARAHPLGRLAEPEEVAAAVAFLASDDASFVTGATLAVDGGMTAGARLDLGEAT